jgi:hypothetical protein
MKRSGRIARTKSLPRGTKTLGRNRKRTAENFARCYHSVARVEWVKSLPSVVSGRGPCVNAHAIGDGAGRKAGYETIVPLTQDEHDELHRIGVKTFGRRYDVDLMRCAHRTENAWKARHPMTSVGEILQGEG